MKKVYLLIISLFSFIFTLPSSAQEIQITERGTLEQVYSDVTESETLLPFNDLNIEFGYVLYETEVEVETEDAVLVLENVRDYAVVYLNDELQGTITDNNKKLTLNVNPGKYTLSLYAENIGRITYGPEILDNSKGLFGNISLDDAEVENWTMIPLEVKTCDVKNLQFQEQNTNRTPAFYRGHFEIDKPEDIYLNITGWGMGEAWVNGNYIGSYWEEEKQQSIQIPADNLLKGRNEIIVFELKNSDQRSMNLSDKPIFK